jgi:hypothetical protein
MVEKKRESSVKREAITLALRELAVRHVIANKPVAEVSEWLGMSKSSVKVNIDVFLDEIQSEINQLYDVIVSLGTIYNYLKREGISCIILLQ